MCELLGKSSRRAATINLALTTFAAHGGGTAPNKDGWGVAYYEGGDVRLIKDTHRAADSPWVRFVEDQGLATTTAIGHVRYATTGNVALRNTHPFSRELGGCMHVFAHNGSVDGVFTEPDFRLQHYRPVGATDSEHAFCALLTRLAPLWHEAGGPPPLEQRLDVIAEFAARLRGFGPANFLYADGTTLFAHSHMRHQSDGTRRPPGLHMLQRSCVDDGEAIHGGGVHIEADGEDQSVILVASVPLTDGPWEPLGLGSVLALEGGAVVAHRAAS